MENKTGKYLKYAIGEIVLVVIGILVALHLNNWNGTRIQNAAFENLIEALEKELNFNIEESNYELHWGTVYMERYTNLMNENVSIDKFKTDKEYFAMIVTNKLDVIYDDIQVMINKQDQFPNKYKVLIPHLKKFNNLFTRYKASEADLEKITLEYIKYLVLHEQWFGNKDLEIIDSEANLQRLEFQLTNPTFKNFLKEHNFRYTESLRNMSGIRATCIVLIAQIKKIRDHYSELEIQQEIAKHGLKPFKSYSCETNDIKDLPMLNLETLYPFFNASETTAFIKWTDDTKHQIELQPGEITINSFTDRIKGGQLITLEGKECRIKFETDVNGYLLIENKHFNN